MLGFEEDSPDKEKSIIHYSFCRGDERHTGNQAQFMVDLEKRHGRQMKIKLRDNHYCFL